MLRFTEHSPESGDFERTESEASPGNLFSYPLEFAGSEYVGELLIGSQEEAFEFRFSLSSSVRILSNSLRKSTSRYLLVMTVMGRNLM